MPAIEHSHLLPRTSPQPGACSPATYKQPHSLR
jgi:hypothetical protein